MLWTTDEILRELPRIRRFKAVQEAYLDGIDLVVVTRGDMLRHTRSMLTLPSMKIVLTNSASALLMLMRLKYSNALWGWFHWHPTLGKRVGLTKLRSGCLGKAGDELLLSKRQGPLMATVAALAILQTIQAEDAEDAAWPWFDRIGSIAVTIMLLTIPTIVIIILLKS